MSVVDKFKNWKANKRIALLEELLEVHYSIGDVVSYPDPPAFEVCWHDTPDSIHRARWTGVAEATDMTYDDFFKATRVGQLHDTSNVEITGEQEVADMQTQGCYAFCNWLTNEIHIWLGDLPYDDPRTEEILHTMIASEIAHLTPNRHRNEQLEMYRAMQYAVVARSAKAVLVDALGLLKGKQV
ncbi:hypothetical protein FDJ23_gp041 [Erwinia phage vB_EamM_Desertfox]|uniref:Uncharacterized protein n=1 Tax=Erwinia phage vB_EamM_Desertfox TaxID=2060127 RepID=A0A2H5BIK5_9CAUD|nr:hypothetical protein FDJ23_gp041 [Erwinia phage vB_EamM_Desertfox]AUG86149.1 hypothetical protein DESERTFOX_41 [Erwinia phage vB_EamM_Desertfox]